jgi:hypothetical protein
MMHSPTSRNRNNYNNGVVTNIVSVVERSDQRKDL